MAAAISTECAEGDDGNILLRNASLIFHHIHPTVYIFDSKLSVPQVR